MAWTTLTLQVTTPLFNGGADPDGSAGLRPAEEPGVRVASIRGAMRFWFRALAGALTGPDVALLARLERRVFGGASDERGGSDVPASSPLVLRLPDPPRLCHEYTPPFLQARERRWISYLLGLGLMKLDGGRPYLIRPFVPPGTSFDLKLQFRHGARTDPKVKQAIEALALVSLWLTCTYGGIGARTRRGFGGIQIIAAHGELPYPWSQKYLLTPGLSYYKDAEWLWPSVVFRILEPELCVLMEAERRELSADAGDVWPAQPSFPVLSNKYSPATLVTGHPHEFRSWEEALGYGGRQLRLFRANRPSDESTRRQARVRTMEWDDVVNGESVNFPLGALGLPVVYHEKGRRGAQDRELTVNALVPSGGPGKDLRRASPLWLRPVGSDDSWGLFTFAIQAGLLPESDSARVYLRSGGQGVRDDDGKELTIASGDVQRLTNEWIRVMRDGGDFTKIIRK